MALGTMNQPASATENFRAVLKSQVAPALTSRGFQKKGNTFARWRGQNCQVINFARDPDSTPARYELYVDLGVINRTVYWFEHGVRPPAVPVGKELHWWTRLDEFLSHRKFWGWAVEDATDAERAASEIVQALEVHGLPLLDRNATDKALLEIWSHTLEKYTHGSITPLLRLSVLAKTLAEDELSQRAVAKAIEACGGLPCERTVAAHRVKLENWRPPRASAGQGKSDSYASGRSDG